MSAPRTAEEVIGVLYLTAKDYELAMLDDVMIRSGVAGRCWSCGDMMSLLGDARCGACGEQAKKGS